MGVVVELKKLLTFLSFKLTDIIHPVFFITVFLYLILVKIMFVFFPDITKIIVVYPSLGLAIAILLIYGSRFWPAVFVGFFIAFFIQGHSSLFSFLIAISTVFEVLLGVILLTIKNNFDYSLRTSKDYFKLFFIVGVFSTAVGALLYSLVFYAFEIINHSDFLNSLKFIWMGHIMGVIVVAPFALIWKQKAVNFTKNSLLEIILFFGFTFLAGQAIFLDWFYEYFGAINRGYWMYLFVSIAAIRFGRHGASLIILMVAIQGLYGAYNGVGFFSVDIVKTGLINYWVYTMVVVVVGMAQATFITERKKEANYDSLTSLPNRRLFNDRLEMELKKAKRENYPVTLLFMDLDHFKEVNDTLGHHVGDSLLIVAAQRIQNCVRESDTVARLGGDEFTILLPNIGEIGKIERIATEILAAIDSPFYLKEKRAHLTTSIGITVYPNDGETPQDLLMHADQAMYSAKNSGRNKFSYFTQEMQNKALSHMQLTNDIQIALEEKQFLVYYQPIVDLKTGEIIKAEALIRWNHPTLGMISPTTFIPIAEEKTVINEIGSWVFKTAASNVQRWSKIVGHRFTVGINVSPVQFIREEKQLDFIEYLKNENIECEHISIEITEGLLLKDGPEIMEKLLEFRKAGIKIAIDDFGTGYSSLSYLKKFPIDHLKIDQSFIFELITDKSSQALSKAIIAMAHALDLKVIAEGVETEAQRDMLINFGCDYVQGYFYARPMPADQFEKFLIDKYSVV